MIEICYMHAWRRHTRTQNFVWHNSQFILYCMIDFLDIDWIIACMCRRYFNSNTFGQWKNWRNYFLLFEMRSANKSKEQKNVWLHASQNWNYKNNYLSIFRSFCNRSIIDSFASRIWALEFNKFISIVISFRIVDDDVDCDHSASRDACNLINTRFANACDYVEVVSNGVAVIALERLRSPK